MSHHIDWPNGRPARPDLSAIAPQATGSSASTTLLAPIDSGKLLAAAATTTTLFDEDTRYGTVPMMDIAGAANRAVTAYDVDGDGAVSVADDGWFGTGLFGNDGETVRDTDIGGKQVRVSIALLAADADRLGNGDGAASVDEIQSVLRSYDRSGDGRLIGTERSAFLAKYAEADAPAPAAAPARSDPAPDPKPAPGAVSVDADASGWFESPYADVTLHVTTPDGVDHELHDHKAYTSGWGESDWQHDDTAHFSLDYGGKTYTYEVPVHMHRQFTPTFWGYDTSYETSATGPVHDTTPVT